MRAGKLRTKVTFQQETQTADGGGGYAVDWTGDKIVFCEYRAQSGKEQAESGRLEASARATLRARNKSVTGITAGWRATIGGVPWNILSVVEMGQRDRMTEMVIERGVAV